MVFDVHGRIFGQVERARRVSPAGRAQAHEWVN